MFSSFEDGVAKVCEEWNAAEEAIKLAEQVNGQIVQPAVQELRYAGRRLVEALAIFHQDEAEALQLLRDAHFDCCRARHDAIDAATSRITIELGILQKRIGARHLLNHAGDVIISLKERLDSSRRLIAQSRRNRSDRNQIYETLQAVDLPEIVDLYRRLVSSRELLESAARWERAMLLLSYLFGGLGSVGGLIYLVNWLRGN